MWLLVGLSVFSLMRMRSSFHLRLLLAPALGLALNIVILFALSRIGLPIKTVAIPVFVVGILLVGHFLFTRSVIWRHRSFAQLCFVIAITVIPFAWPLLKFGFDWLAFVNGDMSYYSLSSARFLDYGYSELPASGNIFDATDHSLAYWFQPNVLGHRAGADILLAHIVGITGLTAHQVYMPLIIACNTCVAIGAGALALITARKWSAALWTIVIVAFSPLLALEVTMQLLAQTAGLAFLASLCVAYNKSMQENRESAWPITTIFLFSALAIAYSEVVPFFALYVLVKEVLRARQWMKPRLRKIYVKTSVVLVLGVALLLNKYLIDVVKFVSLAMGGSFKSAAMTIQTSGISLFPHFFLPSGGALLWGWMPLANYTNSVVIIAGLTATLLFVALALAFAIRGNAPSQMSVVMLTVAASMYIGGNGFGLFKIGMYIQPFMLATCISVAVLYITRKKILQISLACLGLSFIPASGLHVMRVSTTVGHAIVPYASTDGIAHQLVELGDAARAMTPTRVYSDTPLRELFLLQSYYFKGVEFQSLSTPSPKSSYNEKYSPLLSTTDKAKLSANHGNELEFDFGASGPGVPAKFFQSDFNVVADTLLSATREFSIINRSTQPAGRKLYLQAINDLENHLVFKQTSQGTSFLSKNFADGGVALWVGESDPMFSKQTMSSVGRYHVYEVLGVKQGSRILVSLTDSMNKQDDFLLPTVQVVGNNSVRLPLVGRGSARVLSPPVDPRKLGNSAYIGIDFGRSGSFFEQERSGPMRMFGKNIKLDIRKTVAFARDISYITPGQYNAFKRPENLHGFPSALQNPGLEYSGIFEDAWVSDIAYVILNAPQKGQQRVLHLLGQIPDIEGAPFSTTLTIKINNEIVYSGLHTKGDVNISIPVVGTYDSRKGIKVQIESSGLQRLPRGDGRPVSLLLKELGFAERPVK